MQSIESERDAALALDAADSNSPGTTLEILRLRETEQGFHIRLAVRNGNEEASAKGALTFLAYDVDTEELVGEGSVEVPELEPGRGEFI